MTEKQSDGLTLVRTGPFSYLKLNADDLKAWKARGNKEYGAAKAEPKATTEPASDNDATEPQAKDTSLDAARKANDNDAIAARAVGVPKSAAKKTTG